MILLKRNTYQRSLNEISRFLTSTGSLLPAGLLGVLALRGVFAEAGVFGLNGRKGVNLTLKMVPVDTTKFDTYIGFIAI